MIGGSSPSTAPLGVPRPKRLRQRSFLSSPGLWLGPESGAVVRGHRLMPGNQQLAQLGDNVGILTGKILRFASVGSQIVKFRLGAVVFAKQLPFAVADGKVWQIIVAVEGVTIGVGDGKKSGPDVIRLRPATCGPVTRRRTSRRQATVCP